MIRSSCWCVLVVTLLASCADEAPPVEPLIRSIRYTVVGTDDGARKGSFSGVVKAGTETRLSFQVAGRVQSVQMQAGDRVKKGKLLASLDPADFELVVAEARASAGQADAQARSADSTYQRVRALYESRTTSQQELDNARAQRDTAKSAASAAQQAVRRLVRQRDYTNLKATDDGTIARVDVEANEVVGAGQVVALLQVGERLEVAIDVPGSQINYIERGDEVSVAVPSLRSGPLRGTITEVGIPDQQSTVFPVRVQIGNKIASKVRSGMAAEVTFQFQAGGDAALIKHLLPASAVGEDRDGRFVFLVKLTDKGFGTVARQPVEVGEFVGSQLEIPKGIEDGQLVVTAGVSRIQDGLRVRVPPLEGPAAAAAGVATQAAGAGEVAPAKSAKSAKPAKPAKPEPAQ